MLWPQSGDMENLGATGRNFIPLLAQLFRKPQMPLRSHDALRKVKLPFLYPVAQLGTPLSQMELDSHQYETASKTSSISIC